MEAGREGERESLVREREREAGAYGEGRGGAGTTRGMGGMEERLRVGKAREPSEVKKNEKGTEYVEGVCERRAWSGWGKG